ncbi:MAG: 2Fe-2S iron-sulfur cluster-binding protein, partial [Hydrogenoanaerobacterium sp.]
MSKFIVNGEPAEALKDEKLIYFLRDSLNLTSVKNGCSEGACGTCMVLVDGKATKACILTTARVEGKSIITAEGLTEREKDVYGYAFSHAGAVQCGFCTPGMVISAKALLDVNLSPTRADVKEAIKNNICRCTGYKKIEDAILLSASIFKENSEVPHHDFTGIIGENLHRVDAAAKAL